MSESIVSLTVNDLKYHGWLSATITRSMKSISGGFSLGITDVWTPDGRPWPIIPGDECIIKIDDEPVITGYVDDVNPSYSGDSHSIACEGRDKAADLVDCSAGTNPGTFQKTSLEKLAKKLCDPFGITVQMNVSIPDLFQWKVHPSESVFETLDRAARARQVLIYSDGLGKIIFDRTGTDLCATALIQGENIVQASAKYSHRERFSTYSVKSQLGGWSQSVSPETATGIIATSTDSYVKRHRPLEVVAEATVDTKTAKKRADWEMSTRKGKSSVFSITVEGFRQQDGELWKPNTLVQVYSPWLGVDRELLITEVQYSYTEEKSQVTVLQVELKEAYQILNTSENARDQFDDLGLGLG